ncbi:MAG: hypothetical protein RR704_04285 [Stenotrophomonas sp.]|uniref:hypothetical protein n=1 Tax=Stenotrophomonas sp. TaxID=69392 RepID=UPI002FC61F54
MRLTLLLPLLLAVAGCTSTPSPGAAVPADATTTATPAPLDAAACRQAGGELMPLGRLQRVQCVVPYADAGRACSAKADCSGQCLAEGEVTAGVPARGVCQTDLRQNFGCRQRIDGGVAQGTICVD